VWAQSANAGGSWQTQATSPLFLGVTGDPTVVIVELRTDVEAIQSAVFSGLPTALAQREIVFSAVAVSTRDVNERLFRLRSGADVQRGWEVFVTGRYGAADMDAILPTTGFRADTWAGTVGVEYHDARHLTVGAAFTLMESENSLGIGVGDVDLSGHALAAYVSYTHRGFYADLLYQYAKFDHEIARNTLFGETARAEPESDAHTFELNVGYNIETKGFVTGPFAGLTYTTGDLDGYTETGGGTKNVHVAGQSFESLVSRIGWQISKTFDAGRVKITPQARIAWRHEFMNESEAVDIGLVQSPFAIGDGRTFTPVGRFDASSNTEAPGADALEIGVGVALRFSDRMTLILDYEARVFQGDGVLHSVSLTGGVRF
jgi:outer membrane autotransporter protein